MAVHTFREVSSRHIGRKRLVGIFGVSSLGISTTHLSFHHGGIYRSSHMRFIASYALRWIRSVHCFIMLMVHPVMPGDLLFDRACSAFMKSSNSTGLYRTCLISANSSPSSSVCSRASVNNRTMSGGISTDVGMDGRSRCLLKLFHRLGVSHKYVARSISGLRLCQSSKVALRVFCISS